MVDRMRKRLVIKRTPSGEGRGPADDLWDQEEPMPGTPVVPTAPAGGTD